MEQSKIYINQLKSIVNVEVYYIDVAGAVYFKCFIASHLFAKWSGGAVAVTEYDFYKYVVYPKN